MHRTRVVRPRRPIRRGFPRGFAVLLAWWILTPAPAAAQVFSDLLFRQLTVHDGLSSNNINSIAQDRHGFVWIGTRGGLNRYDGYDITTYRSADDDSLSLYDDNVWTVLVDHEGFLWAGTGKGLNRYDGRRDRLVRVPLEAGPTARAKNVRVLFEDRRQRLWVGTDKGLFLRHPATGRFEAYEAAGLRPGSSERDANLVLAIGEDRQGRLWIGTRSGLSLLDETRRTFGPATPSPEPHARVEDEVRHVAGDAAGGVWVATQQYGLLHFVPGSPEPIRYHRDAPEPYRLPSNSVRFVHLNEGRYPIVGTAGGLSVYDPQRRTMVHHSHTPGDPYGLTSNSVRVFFVDRQRNWWIGTWEGVNYYAWQRNHVRMARAVPGRTSGLRDNYVYALTEAPDGRLWAGTQQAGVHELDAERRSVAVYGSDGDRSGPLAGDNVHALLVDRSGALWVGLFEAGLCRRGPDDTAFTCFQNDPDDPGSLSDDNVYALLEDHRGRLWAGTNKAGLNRYDPARRAFVRYDAGPRPGSLIGASVTSLLEDRSGRLWVGTTKGLSRYRPETDAFVTYTEGQKPTAGLPSVHVLALHEAADGTVWVATRAGLSRYEPGADRFVHVGLPSAEANEHPLCLMDDRASRLWVMTERRLLLFDPTRGRIVDHDLDTGFYRMRFNERSCLRGRDGLLYFGSTNGLIRLNPSARASEPHASPIYLTGLSISNQPVTARTPDSPLPAPPHLLSELVLPHEQNTLTFRYAALNFVEPGMTRYAYQLEGYDDAWNDVGTQRTASYTKIPAGTYTFRVRTADREGNWLAPGVVLRLRVLPPWWRSGGAWLAYLLLASTLLYGAWWYWGGLVRLRAELAREQLRRESEEALRERQVRFFTNISHEFRTPLTLIRGPLELLQARERSPAGREQLQIVGRNVDRLLYLINQLLDFRKLESGHLEVRAGEADLVAFIRAILLVFEDHARRRNVTLALDTAHPALPAWFDAGKLETVVTNLLANAVKFSPEGGRVAVHLWRSDDADAPASPEAPGARTGPAYAGIAVRDEGRGLAPEELAHLFEPFYQARRHRQQGTGIGLALARGIVEQHGGRMTVASEPHQGTAFVVWLPLGRLHLHAGQIAGGEAEPVSAPALVLPPDVPSAPAAVEDAASANGAPRPRVLVVDDHADMRIYLRRCMEPAYQVREAASGEEGLPLALAWQPDLIVSDVMMEEMDGAQFCERLKRDVRTQHIPVVLLTARTSTEHRLAGYEAGADAYVTKPFVLEELLAQVRNLILRRQRLQERLEHPLPLVLPAGFQPGDDRFVERVAQIVQERMDDPDLNVQALSAAMDVSRVHLHKKMKALLHQSPSDFIRSQRLRAAARLLLAGDLAVSEVAYRVGFTTPSHFATSFKKHYGQSPSDCQAAAAAALRDPAR